MEITQNYSIYMFLTIGLNIMKISPSKNPTHLEGFSKIPRACQIDLPKIFSFDFVEFCRQNYSIYFNNFCIVGRSKQVLQNLLTAPLLIKGNPKVWRAQKVAT